MIFLSPPMTYTCQVKSGTRESEVTTVTTVTTVTGNVCPCNKPVWDLSIFSKTVQTKFGLICEQKWLISCSESMTFLGLLIGALIFGILSDRYGRLSMYSLCQAIIGGAGCLVSVMPSIYFFIFMRFLEGVGSGGAIVTGFVLCVEYCGPKYRGTISSLLHFPTNFGLLSLVGISYLLRDCDHFQLAVSIPVLFLVSLKFLLYESPKWLLDNNRKEEAIQIMENICRYNKKHADTIRADMEAFLASQTEDTTVEALKFYHIFKHKTHAINFCCMSYMFFVCGMCYYGVSQFIGKMSKHVHFNTLINGILLLIGTVFSLYIVNKLGRKPFLRACMILSGAFMFAVVCVPISFKPGWIRILFACLASSCYYVSFLIVYLYGVELFPTNIRNSALGFLSLSARVGQILGPIINALSSTLAGCIFGSIAIIGAILTFILPETRGAELPSSFEQVSRLPPPSVSFSKLVHVRTSEESQTDPVADTAVKKPNSN